MPESALATRRVDRCPLCGSEQSSQWLANCRERRLDGRPQPFSYRRCAACDTRFLHERPLPSEMHHIYYEGYGPYVGHEGIAPSAGRHPLRRGAALACSAAGAVLERVRPSRLDELTADFLRDGDGGAYVDYGCGRPDALDAAKAQGWHTLGVDLEDDVLAAIRAAGHDTMLRDAFDTDVADGSVARLRISHVIEHVDDPPAILAMLRRKLRPGGRLHLVTPNPVSWGAQLFRQQWYSLDAPRHFALMPPKALLDALREAGFSAGRIEQELVGKDLIRSYGYRLHDKGRLSTEEAIGLADVGDAIRFTRPVAAAARLSRRSDRYHAFATA